MSFFFSFFFFKKCCCCLLLSVPCDFNKLSLPNAFIQMYFNCTMYRCYFSVFSFSINQTVCVSRIQFFFVFVCYLLVQHKPECYIEIFGKTDFQYDIVWEINFLFFFFVLLALVYILRVLSVLGFKKKTERRRTHVVRVSKANTH